MWSKANGDIIAQIAQCLCFAGALLFVGNAWAAWPAIALALLGALLLVLPPSIPSPGDTRMNWRMLSRRRFISIAACVLATPIAVMTLVDTPAYGAAWLAVFANAFVVATTSMIYLREYDDLGIGQFTGARQKLVLELVKEWEEKWPTVSPVKPVAAESIHWFGIAATDVFVEKAQAILSRRAAVMYATGFLTLVASIGVLSVGAYLANKHLDMAVDSVDGRQLAVKIFQMVGFTAFFFFAAGALMSVCRAFFHEAMVLYSRRHALRFGRLYVYLRDGRVDFRELEEAFQWNRDATSAFRSIDVTALMTTLHGKLADTAERLAIASMEKHSEKAAKAAAKAAPAP